MVSKPYSENGALNAFLTERVGDGTCVIDIENLPWAYEDRATMTQIRAAALHLMDKCVFGERAGGITTGLGVP